MYYSDNRWRGIRDGAEFEKACFNYWASKPYIIRIDITPSCGDYGADIVMTTAKGNTVVVQCKHSVFAGRHVGLEPIQEVVAAKTVYGAQYTIVMSNMKFSNGAKVLARDNKVYIAESIILNRDGTLSGVHVKSWHDITVNQDKRMGDVDLIRRAHAIERERLRNDGNTVTDIGFVV